MEYSANFFQLDGLEIRGTLAVTSGPVDFGAIGFGKGLVMLESDLDQSVVVSVQGRHKDCPTWQAVNNATVTAGGVNKITVSHPWGQLRLSCVCSVAPASGALKAILCRVRG